MTICRTSESGGLPARPANATWVRVPLARDAGAVVAFLPRLTAGVLAVTRRAEPPDFELLRRVRDGLKRL